MAFEGIACRGSRDEEFDSCRVGLQRSPGRKVVPPARDRTSSRLRALASLVSSSRRACPELAEGRGPTQELDSRLRGNDTPGSLDAALHGRGDSAPTR